MSPIDAYLNQIERELRALPAPIRQGEVREMRAHLEQLVEDGIAAGLDPEAAAQAALSHFGEARGVATGVRDVWEGQQFSWRRVLAALVCGSTFWVGAIQALFFGAANFYFWSQHGLFPEVFPLIHVLSWLIPFLTGIIFSAWLGRRAWILSAVFFTVGTAFVTSALYGFVVALNSLSIRLYFSPIYFPFWATLCSCGVGVVGALAGTAFQRRRRYAKLAMVASQTSGAAPNSRATRARREKWPLKIALALVMAGGILAGAFWRIDTTLRPRTPAGALRLQFYSVDLDPSRYPAPKILELRELAPQMPAELAGQERRVAFHIELSATEAYVKSRVAYLQAQLKLRQRNPIDKKALRSSLQRVRANAYRIRSVATVKRTPIGWQVEENSFDSSRLRGWIEDIYHDH